MAQVIIRNLDPAVVSALKARAAAHGHSLEQELRNLLTAAARPTAAERRAAAASIRRLRASRTRVDLDALIREERDR